MCVCVCVCAHPWTKINTPVKNEEKDIVYNLKIMKIRYMKDKAKRQSKLKYEEISIHFLYVY